MTLYETRGGCIALCHRGCCIKICIRLLFPLKVHLLEVWIDVLTANSCSHMKAKSVQQSPSLCRTLFHSCSERAVCVRAPRLQRSTDGTERTRARSRLCGLPCSFSQSKCSGKWRRCIKTWPGQQRGMDADFFFSAENFNHAFIQVRLRDRNWINRNMSVCSGFRYVTLVLARKFLHPKLKYH